MRTLNRVSISLCLILLLASCATETIVDRPVPVEVIRYERVPIPAELLQQFPKTVLPESVTYGELVGFCADDRAKLDIVNAKLAGIKELDSD